MARLPKKTSDIRVSCPISAAPQEVYRALVSARELCVWWLDRAETDARNMGRLRMVWAAPDGKNTIEMTGVFVDLEPAGKVAWIWDAGTRPRGVPALVSFFIEPSKKSSQLTIIHAGFSGVPSRRKISERYREIWEDVAAKLKLYLESDRTCKGERLTLDDVRLLEKTG